MMLNARTVVVAGCLAAVLAGAPGCLVRRRVITRPTTATGQPRQLITASREDLVRRLQNQYDAVRAINATVDMTPALGSVYKGEITEYKDIRAYVLIRKPTDIRIIGLAPVVRSKVFDMVSTGQDFQILLPAENRFIKGRNDAPPVSKNSLENLRPEAFLEAMLVPPPDLSVETALLIDATDEENALYILVLVGKTAEGKLTIDRTIFFDRTTLFVVRQKRYNDAGETLSDTRYRDFKVYGKTNFPSTIDINRPKDGYGVVIGMVKLEMNVNLTDDKFVLTRPEGTELKTIGEALPPKAPAK
jgi:outer membrane lipoprotein-sorting protein